MATKIKWIVHSSMDAQETLRLRHQFEPALTSFSYPSWFVRKLGAIVGVLRSIVNRIGDKLSVGDAVTSQFISDDFPRFFPAFLEKPFEEALSSFAISTNL